MKGCCVERVRGKRTVEDQPTELHKCRMGKPDDQETSVPLHGGQNSHAPPYLVLKELT